MFETAPIVRLEELEKHLDVLDEAPETPLDSKLLDDVELQLNEHNSLPLLPKLLPKLVGILFRLQQDPTALVSLSIKLIKPLSFTDALSFSEESSLVLALQSPSPAANKLGLEVISKATKLPANVARLSVMKNLVTQLIRTWLSTPDVGVADKAENIISEGLKTDCEHPLPILNDFGEYETRQAGQGLLWRRIFFDQDILDIIFHLCSRSSTLDPRQKTLAQSRLAAIMPGLAQVNFAIVSNSTLPEVESRYGSKSLLEFVAVRMIDSANEEDELIRITHYRFWYELFASMSKVQCPATTTRKLTELVVTGMELDGNLEPFLRSGVLHVADDPADVECMMRLLGKLDLGLEREGDGVDGMDG